MEQRENISDKNKTGVFTEPSYAIDKSDEIDCVDTLSGELAEGINCSVSGQAYSINVSELKFPDQSLACFSSSLDAELETYNKIRERISKVYEDKSEVGMLGKVCNNMHFSYKESDVDEDSQLEYHSAEEQDYSGQNTSYMPFMQIKTPRTQNSEFLELVEPLYEVICDGAIGGQNPVSKLDDGSFALDYGAVDEFYNKAAIPELSKTSQDSISLIDYKGLKCETHEEEQTEDTYHSMLAENSFESDTVVNRERAYQKSLSMSSSENQQKMEAVSSCGVAQSSQMAIKKVFKMRDGHSTNSMLQKHGNTCVLPWERSSVTSTQISIKNADSSISCSCEESFLSAFNSDCHDCSQKTVERKPDFSFALPRIPMKDGQLSCVEVTDKYAGNSTRHQVDFPNSEIKCLTCLNNVTSNNKVTVNQTVDASSDFRACFTTSRATSANASVVSKANNTKLTMMNKIKSEEWQSETCRSIACNTDLSCVGGSMEQIASWFTETWENCIYSEIPATEWNSQIKDPLELKNKLSVRDLRENPDRMFHLRKEIEKNYSSSCCRMMLQRAVKAELQLLRTHYWLCHQHCWKIYRLVMEERECFNRNFKSEIAKTELGSSLLSVFEELNARYESTREKIVLGIPLDSLPPLSVESKLLSIFSSYVPSKLVKDDLLYNSSSAAEKSGLEMSKHQESEISSSLKRTPPLVTPQMCLTDNRQNKHYPSYKNFEIKYEAQDIERDCRKNQEINEDWFDAKENFTVTDFSVALQGNEKQQENLQKVISTTEIKMVENTKSEPNKHYFIHVGGLSPSVSEVDLRSHFQKYQVLEVSICEFSTNYRYASLSFKQASKAKLAVEEMNGKEIKGKAVNVRPVKTAGEYIFPASQKVSRPLHYENQTTDNLEENIQVRTTCSVPDSLKVPSTTSTSLKVLSPPSVSSAVPAPILASSKVLSSDLQPLRHESGHLLFSVDQQSIRENPLQIKPVQFSPNPSATFIPPNTLNLSSFTKLMKKLKELHPKASRDKIVDALLEVRTNNKGFLSGLSINAIVEMASFVLRKSASKCDEKVA
ncbi:RNA-binding protein 44 isoform X1 [Mauremys reevesii]|uniref:RNA-binding protein 44 isoform X1 n=2 Tax=Mauremys reevesii TaxID=260615 RepID=UPI00193ED17E|nr:RNA-binding protein 44 isoform X1 [Mauremys reevesii]XP_039351448.1 RNA-binding protein 44 isoform X1 [Mauremys reevesii]XP_039351449.1 RNA-binding protein 44 isoform X1 [Mauremys reevesii]XP_039351451.1 RNA-binding protein 44 isoform X1 [Mauremys reevesii]XP_039351452.1 RNA-binding protein 44 isoform X1 [Mauremys reevesii]XP_039351453.1 RNA-binding protein 44 isoform X1 [Mauremys reevesii]XP_039351454.1 RNA-binding protein 44 isoform X1 [Mauremys reevesii]